MFDHIPDADLVADLVASQATPPVADPEAAAVELIEQLVAWQRVASWVEAQRLDTMRRFAEARTAADRTLTCAPDADPSEHAAVGRRLASLREQAGRYGAEEVALALNVSPTSVAKQLTLANDLHSVHRELGEALELGQVSGFVAMMVATATRKLPDAARRAVDGAVTTEAVELPAGKAIEAARARVHTLDEYSEERAARARDERRIFCKPLEDDMAMVGAVLPAPDALRAFEQLDRDARAAKAAGADGPLDHLRCEGFVD